MYFLYGISLGSFVHTPVYMPQYQWICKDRASVGVGPPDNGQVRAHCGIFVSVREPNLFVITVFQGANYLPLEYVICHISFWHIYLNYTSVPSLYSSSPYTSQCFNNKRSITAQHAVVSQQGTSNGSWCIGIKGEMSGTVCVTFTWDIYIYISCL